VLTLLNLLFKHLWIGVSQECHQTLLVGLANTGNVMFRGGGRVAIQNSSQHRILSRPFLVDTFVPHTSVRYPLQLPGRPLRSGRYRVIFPAFALTGGALEPWIEASSLHLLLAGLGFAVAHAVLSRIRSRMFGRQGPETEPLFTELGLRSD